MKNALELQNVSKSFKGFEMKDMTFSLPEGCILGLVGKNGAGKSTTIRLIMDMIHKDNGTIYVLGKNIEEDFTETKQDIGVVLDEPSFPEYVTADQMNNIMKNIYRNWDEKRYYELIDQFELPKWKKQFKNYSKGMKKFKIPTKKTIGAFSKGMKMKLAIAVALSHHAKLLILDEPTSGLDPFMRDEILDILYEFTREEDQSVLISSHIISDLERLCDYIAYIDQGSLKLYEEKDCLIEQYGILKCSKEELKEFDEQAVKGVRENPYGVEALVDRSKMPKDYETDMATLEEIIVFLSKGQEE